MFPLRDLQDDPKHEKLQGLREEAVLQCVSLCSGCHRESTGPGRCCGVCWTLGDTGPDTLEWEVWGALTSAEALSPLLYSIFWGCRRSPGPSPGTGQLMLVLTQCFSALQFVLGGQKVNNIQVQAGIYVGLVSICVPLKKK